MKSLDTQLLVYAFNEDCPEHAAGMRLLVEVTEHPRNWLLADQVLVELYRCLRNPKVLTKPLSAVEAWKRIEFMDRQVGCRRCGWEHRFWPQVSRKLATRNFAYQRTFDVLLAATLLANGVKEFYTRNDKDFEGLGFEQIINPIDGD